MPTSYFQILKNTLDDDGFGSNDETVTQTNAYFDYFEKSNIRKWSEVLTKCMELKIYAPVYEQYITPKPVKLQIILL